MQFPAELTDSELTAHQGEDIFFDIESYQNYFLAAFLLPSLNKIVTFEASASHSFNPARLSWLLNNYRTVGFNSLRFDLPISWLAYQCPYTDVINQGVQDLINNNFRTFELEIKYGFKNHSTRSIDLMPICPLKGSLKTYAARLHAPRLQDLPFSPDRILTQDEALAVKDYCINADLQSTQLIYNNLREQITLREDLSREYNIDLLSKSDAQIAEAVIGTELERITGKKPKRPELKANFAHKYQTPAFIKFQTPLLKHVLATVEGAIYSGPSDVPESIKNLDIKIGQSRYQMGNGGLHSCEKSVAHIADETTGIFDHDAASFYPYIIINCGLYPKQMGTDFLVVYKTLVTRRLAAKKAKQNAIADALKIVINSSYGKFGSEYSILSSPETSIQVTLTGQLSLLMLIERLENVGLSVISANTDGIVIKCERVRKVEMISIIELWAKDTGFITEETEYKAMYSRDINAYISMKLDGTHKAKNSFFNPWAGGDKEKIWRFTKNPQCTVCIEAAIAFITAGTDVETTIRACRDITKFVAVRKVEGGASKDGAYIGKVIRWYYARSDFGYIEYASNGNKVPDTDGAKPLMTLAWPDDIDYDYYIARSVGILEEMSFIQKKSKKVSFFDF